MILVRRFDEQDWGGTRMKTTRFLATDYIKPAGFGGTVRLWKKQGFDLIGTLPRAFRHRQSSCVDAYVMYKQRDANPADAYQSY